MAPRSAPPGAGPGGAAFRIAQRRYQRAVRAWNALATSCERAASGIDLGGAIDAYQAAAHTLITEAAGRHAVEDAARIHLILTADGWAVDPARTDGAADSAYEQPIAERCDHDEALNDECDALIDAAEVFGLPSLRDLVDML